MVISEMSRQLSLDNATNEVLFRYKLKFEDMYIQTRGREVTMIYSNDGCELARIVTLYSDYMYESTITFLEKLED